MKYLILLIMSAQISFAEELVKILAISKTKKSFIVRTGFEKHVTPGSLAAFITENFSFTARANVVTREYAQWEVIEPNLTLPLAMHDHLIFSKNVESSQRVFKNESLLDQHELIVGLNDSSYLARKERAIADHLKEVNNPKEKKFDWEKYLEKEKKRPISKEE